ncbi:PH domain-containing protein [Candidatus Daviesbacteria bacterium]|nr:PH domain-containing protein [Candidatus Daviesbacteria bacterium]
MATENTAQSPNSQSLESEHQKFLAPGEKVIKVFDYANAELMWDLLWGFLPVLLAIILFGFDITGVIIGLFIGSYFILSGLYKKLTLKYLVTDKRVVLKKGLIGQSTVSADYSKITDVTVQQGILGRLILHTGTIVLNTAGTDLGEVILKWVQNPFEAKNTIYAHLHKK